MPFTTSLALKSLRGKNEYQLTECLVFVSDRKSNKPKVFMVPSGFVTDFATIPRIFKSIIDDNDKHIRDAAVLHDFLYSTQSRAHQNISRKEADKVLIDAMKSLGAPWWKRALIYSAVRVGGGSYFKKY
jgi:hypothetical protein